jgi:enamine deaminase RidA (YjgF/YER057c/UK114 family)
MYTVDVPSFMNIMRDPEVRAKHPWNKGGPSPSTLIGVTALSNPGFLIEVEIAAVVSD